MQFLAAKLNHLAQTLRFPKNPIHEAAVYFWLWRRCVKSGDMECYPESPKDEPIRPAIGNDYSDERTWSGQWTLFYLMYLDSLTWHFPDVFKLAPFEKDKEIAPREKYIFGEVCRQLCGVRTGSARMFYARTGSEAEYRRICSQCAKKYWGERFRKAEKHPALVLALSFYANGFASFKTKSNQKRNADRLNADHLYGLVDRATNYRVFVPEKDWEARAVFFILAQWLFFSDRRIAESTLEEHIFAILYLRFYRQGVDEYFKRESMSTIWDGIPYDKKEDVAVHYRRLLADTRNKAAIRWPNARISDYPEADNSAVFGEVFHDLVRAMDYKRLSLLLQEDVVYAPYRNVELLWAASHSKKMYEWLQRLVKDGETVLISELEDEADIVKGWRNLPIEDMAWSYDTIKSLVSPELFSRLMAAADSLWLWLPDDGEETVRRLKAYLEDLHVNPNKEPTDAPYDTSKPPLYDAVFDKRINTLRLLLAHGANPNCGGHRTTSLSLAVGSPEIMKLLLESGADPNLPSCSGWVPAQSAILEKDVESLRLLVAAGAVVRFSEWFGNWFQQDVVDFWQSQSDDVKKLLESPGQVKEAAKGNDELITIRCKFYSTRAN